MLGFPALPVEIGFCVEKELTADEKITNGPTKSKIRKRERKMTILRENLIFVL